MILNSEWAFINMYLVDKEYHLTYHVRRALNLIDWLIRKKGLNKNRAVQVINKKFKKDYGFDFTEEFLWRCYRQRKAHIKNAKDKFKIWEQDKFMETVPDEMKVNLCACGCGLPVKPGNKYINGHNPRFKNELEKNLHTLKMRNTKKRKSKKLSFLEKL